MQFAAQLQPLIFLSLEAAFEESRPLFRFQVRNAAASEEIGVTGLRDTAAAWAESPRNGRLHRRRGQRFELLRDFEQIALVDGIYRIVSLRKAGQSNSICVTIHSTTP